MDMGIKHCMLIIQSYWLKEDKESIKVRLYLIREVAGGAQARISIMRFGGTELG
jgi:hypothetical protein